jgi:hypothetical protein
MNSAEPRVYAEARTVRADLTGKQRGKIEDTITVFALTVDSDADKGLASSLRMFPAS